MATSSKPKGAKQPSRTFAFDLQKPLFKGNLLKQGEFHKAFKDRFFVLYPGFLVYYDTITTWQYDLQRGETLGSRLNAFKIKGGSIEKAKNPPRGAKYAFVLLAPDPSNKRHSVVFNAKSNEERYQWMVKIRAAIPGNLKAEAEHKHKPLEEKKEEEKEEKPLEEKKEAVSEPKNLDPVIDSSPDPVVQSPDPVIQSPDPVVKHDNTKETTIDNALGPRDQLNSTSSVGSAIDLSSPVEKSPEHNPGTKDETDDDACTTGDVSVVSSVSVEVNKDQRVPHTTLPQSDSLDVPLTEDGVKRDSTLRIVETTETVIPAQDGPRLSITIATTNSPSNSDIDSDSDNSEGVELPGEIPQSPAKKGSTSSDKNPKETDMESAASPSSVTPRISIDQAEDSPVAKNKSPLASPTPDRRRPSGVAAFIEKRGYLYKMGGKHRTWHLRYFILQPGMFTYYKNDPKGKILGEVKLSKRTKIQFPKTGDKKYSSYQFTVYSPSDWNKRSTYAIAANNEREMKEWIEAFKLASGILMDSPERTSP